MFTHLSPRTREQGSPGVSPKSGHLHVFSIQTGSVHYLPACISLCGYVCRVNFFYIEPQKRSRVTKLGTQMQHRVLQRILPPSRPPQSQIACASDIVMVFNNINQATSGSTVQYYCIPEATNTKRVCLFSLKMWRFPSKMRTVLLYTDSFQLATAARKGRESFND